MSTEHSKYLKNSVLYYVEQKTAGKDEWDYVYGNIDNLDEALALAKSIQYDSKCEAVKVVSRKVEVADIIKIENPKYAEKQSCTETKSKRLQLLIQPSLLDELKGKAIAANRSVNDLVHMILEEAIR